MAAILYRPQCVKRLGIPPGNKWSHMVTQDNSYNFYRIVAQPQRILIQEISRQNPYILDRHWKHCWILILQAPNPFTHARGFNIGHLWACWCSSTKYMMTSLHRLAFRITDHQFVWESAHGLPSQRSSNAEHWLMFSLLLVLAGVEKQLLKRHEAHMTSLCNGCRHS